MKVELSTLQDVLTESQIEPKKQQEILEQIQEILKKEKEDRESDKLPRTKAKLGVILIDEENQLQDKNIAALIYEVGADFNGDVLTNIKKAAAEFNNTKKGIKNPVKSILEVFQTVKPKVLKNHQIKKKVKDLVKCVVSNGKI